MIKIEAVVTRERVETVIDAVEEETGHVGVTVVEAIGHGRQRGITHEYRGRVFESRFLPKALLGELVERAEQDGIWTVQAGIFPENEASIALHRGCGFRVVGVRARIGRRNGEWKDVVLMERRSPKW